MTITAVALTILLVAWIAGCAYVGGVRRYRQHEDELIAEQRAQSGHARRSARAAMYDELARETVAADRPTRPTHRVVGQTFDGGPILEPIIYPPRR